MFFTSDNIFRAIHMKLQAKHVQKQPKLGENSRFTGLARGKFFPKNFAGAKNRPAFVDVLR